MVNYITTRGNRRFYDVRTDRYKTDGKLVHVGQLVFDKDPRKSNGKGCVTKQIRLNRVKIKNDKGEFELEPDGPIYDVKLCVPRLKRDETDYNKHQKAWWASEKGKKWKARIKHVKTLPFDDDEKKKQIRYDIMGNASRACANDWRAKNGKPIVPRGEAIAKKKDKQAKWEDRLKYSETEAIYNVYREGET